MLVSITKKTIRKIWKIRNQVKIFHRIFFSTPPKYRKLVRQIAKVSPVWGAHQTICFPDGWVLKGGRDQSRFAQFELPDDLSGEEILDIGCNIGWICLECKKRNAKRVVGVDKNINLIECAKEIASIFKLEIDYYCQSIIEKYSHGSFDYIFMLNVLHHFSENEKQVVLKLCDQITRKKLFIEAPIPGDKVAPSERVVRVEDYIKLIKTNSNFQKLTILGYSEFKRVLILCEK